MLIRLSSKQARKKLRPNCATESLGGTPVMEPYNTVAPFEIIVEIDKFRLQVITPYRGHRKKANLAYETISLDEIELDPDSPVVVNRRKTGKW